MVYTHPITHNNVFIILSNGGDVNVIINLKTSNKCCVGKIKNEILDWFYRCRAEWFWREFDADRTTLRHARSLFAHYFWSAIHECAHRVSSVSRHVIETDLGALEHSWPRLQRGRSGFSSFFHVLRRFLKNHRDVLALCNSRVKTGVMEIHELPAYKFSRL